MEIYLVGGAVRDRLLGYPVYDRDWVVVGARVEEMLDLGYQPVGKDFPVFIHPKTKEEYALARTERKAGHGYKGFSYYASPDVTLEQDLIRRDLTINAMAQDQAGRLVDPYGGQQDLEQRLLRHVSPAFAEDPLRVLRVARFAARYHHLGFRIAEETLRLMQEIARSGELAHLTRERVWKELERALAERSPFIFIDTLRRARALAHLLPELCALFAEGRHTELAAALTRSARLESTPEERFACLAAFFETSEEDDPIGAVCERLRAPRDYRDLALLVSGLQESLQALPRSTAEGHLQLYESLDLQRRPERLSPFLRSCLALDTQFPLSSTLSQDAQLAAYPPARRLHQVRGWVEAIVPRQLVDAGFKGQALGRELRRRRLRALEQQLAQAGSTDAQP